MSTPRQGESGLGLAAQREAVDRYRASLNHPGEVVGEYTEIESGKRHTNRPELAKAVAHAKKAQATLVIGKLDRLARNVHFISGLMESAADFVACDMPHANRLTLHIMASMAEHEREQISTRTRDGLAAVNRELAEKGFRVSKTSGRRFERLGNPRWRESIGRATAARRKAPAALEIRALLESYQRDGLTLRAMAARLNELGLKTPSGGLWYANSVRTMLFRTGLVRDDAA